MVGKPPSAIFVKWLSISNHMMLFSLFAIITTYIYLVIGIEQGKILESFQTKIWWENGGSAVIGILIGLLITGLTFSFFGFGCVGWIKYPDRIVYSENYKRSPLDMFKWDSALNSNASMAVYGTTWPFIGFLILSSFIFINVVFKTKSSHLKAQSLDVLEKLMKDRKLLQEVLIVVENDLASKSCVEEALKDIDKSINYEAKNVNKDVLFGNKSAKVLEKL